MFFSWRSQVVWACAWLVMSVSICRTRGCVAALTVCATSSAAVPATSSLRTSSALSRRSSCTCLQHANSQCLCAWALACLLVSQEIAWLRSKSALRPLQQFLPPLVHEAALHSLTATPTLACSKCLSLGAWAWRSGCSFLTRQSRL